MLKCTKKETARSEPIETTISSTIPTKRYSFFDTNILYQQIYNQTYDDLDFHSMKNQMAMKEVSWEKREEDVWDETRASPVARKVPTGTCLHDRYLSFCYGVSETEREIECKDLIYVESYQHV